jgi:LAGLIDADG DNA endonuclease family
MTKKRKTTQLTQEQKDLIFGTLLGDGNLQTESNGTTWRYRALHSEKQLHYIQHKYDVMKDLIQMQLAAGFSEELNAEFHAAADEAGFQKNVEPMRYYFNTLVDGCFKYYGDMFYTYDTKTKRWVKDVPENIEKLLTPRALAYLHMDDGSLKWKGYSNGMRLCTENFSQEGVNRLKKAIEKLCGIQTTLTTKKISNGENGYRISIPEKSSAAYRATIEPFLVPSMRYKVSDGNKGCLQ